MHICRIGKHGKRDWPRCINRPGLNTFDIAPSLHALGTVPRGTKPAQQIFSQIEFMLELR